jgi:hypothetical protein
VNPTLRLSGFVFARGNAPCSAGTFSEIGTLSGPSDVVTLVLQIKEPGALGMQAYGFGGGTNNAVSTFQPGDSTRSSASSPVPARQRHSSTARPTAPFQLYFRAVRLPAGRDGHRRQPNQRLRRRSTRLHPSHSGLLHDPLERRLLRPGGSVRQRRTQEGFSDLTGDTLPLQTCVPRYGGMQQ